MIEVRQTAVFSEWLANLADEDARGRIVARLHRVSLGNFGDSKPVGGKVSELRVDHGPGYRVYFTRQGRVVVLLLCGGTKRTQAKDIRRAQKMAEET